MTAERWAKLLRELGTNVRVVETWRGQPCDMLVAVHARRSAPSVRRFARAHPGRPIVVVLAGTDVYDSRPPGRAMLEALASATRIVALNPLSSRRLPRAMKGRTRVILQAARAPRPAARQRPRGDSFDLAVVGHLRPVKDPLRAARAARLLPEDSRIMVTHAGAALSPAMARSARREMRANARYRWVGAVTHAAALSLIARSRALVLTSRSEGGPGVVSEAAVAGVPVIASRVDGCVGLLGPRHPGYFDVGDTAGLARLMRRLETEPALGARLRQSSRRLARLLTPEREREAWRRLIEEIAREGA